MVQCVRCGKCFVTHQESNKFFAAPPHPAYEDTPKDAVSDKARIDKATAKMGELMLQGWTMLAESCSNPACPGIPLMRKRGSTKSVCLLCNPGGEEKDSQVEEAQTKVTPPSTSKGVNPKPNTDNALQKKRDMVSSKMGAKLLSGWRMLSQNCSDPNCRGTPLMSKGNNPARLCVCCDKEFGLEPSSHSPREASPRISSLSSSSISPVVSSSGGDSKLQRASSCVSSKLLLGWTMLSAACEECGTPLMKHSQGSHGTPVCINSDCSNCFSEGGAPSLSELNDQIDGMDDEEEYEGEEFEKVVQSYKAKRFAQRQESESQDAPAVLDKRLKSILGSRQKALEAVAHKLSQASDQLMRSSNSVTEDSQLAELIHRLANAAGALERT